MRKPIARFFLTFFVYTNQLPNSPSVPLHTNGLCEVVSFKVCKHTLANSTTFFFCVRAKKEFEYFSPIYTTKCRKPYIQFCVWLHAHAHAHTRTHNRIYMQDFEYKNTLY